MNKKKLRFGTGTRRLSGNDDNLTIFDKIQRLKNMSRSRKPKLDDQSSPSTIKESQNESSLFATPATTQHGSFQFANPNYGNKEVKK